MNTAKQPMRSIWPCHNIALGVALRGYLLLVLWCAGIFGGGLGGSAGLGSLAAQEKLAYTISLYSEASQGQSLQLDTDSNWLPVASIAKELFRRVPKPAGGVLRKWRLRAEYSQFDTQKKAALEVMFAPAEGKALVFVLPWQEQSFVSLRSDRSNWFIPYDEEEGALLDSEAKVSFRVVTEVGNSARLSISEVVLEAWDVVVTQTQLAAGPSLPNIGQTNDDEIELYRQDALQFSLDFVKYGLNGELPKYYYAQAPTVYGLEDGKGYSVYRWPPPQKDYGDVYIDLFVKNYRYKIYDYNELKEIYPEWFSGRRQWVPSKASYLFAGDQVRVGGTDFVSDNILKFVVEYRTGRWQVVARPL